MLFLLSNQLCQSAEGNSTQWPQPAKITNMPHLFLISISVLVSDIAIFVLKKDVKLQLANSWSDPPQDKGHFSLYTHSLLLVPWLLEWNVRWLFWLRDLWMVDECLMCFLIAGSVKFEQCVTCLACHPVDYIIAAGCKEGVIFLW